MRGSSLNGWHCLKTSRSDVRPVRQGGNRIAFLDALNELLGVEVDADRIRSKRRRQHICRRVVDLCEDIELRLENVAIGVIIIQADGQAVIDAPERHDSFCFALTIGQEQVV